MNRQTRASQKLIQAAALALFACATAAAQAPGSAFFNGQQCNGSGLCTLTFPSPNSTIFGPYTYEQNLWILHADMGWEYYEDAGSGEIYFWDSSTGTWFFTAASEFPYLQVISGPLSGATLWYYPDPSNPGNYTSNPRYFYEFPACPPNTSPCPADQIIQISPTGTADPGAAIVSTPATPTSLSINGGGTSATTPTNTPVTLTLGYSDAEPNSANDIWSGTVNLADSSGKVWCPMTWQRNPGGYTVSVTLDDAAPGTQSDGFCTLNLGSGSYPNNPTTTSGPVAITINLSIAMAGAYTVQSMVYDMQLQPSSLGELGTLTLPDFTISLSAPAPATVVAGTQASYLVTVAPVANSGFATNVGLAALGLPAGATANFSPVTIANGNGTSTMTVTSPVSFTAAVLGAAVGTTLSHTAIAPAPLAIQDFTLAVSPSSTSPLIVTAGQTVAFTVSAAGLNSFSTPVSLSLNIPQLQTCSTCIGENLAEGSVTPGGGSVTFTWVVPSNTWGSTYAYSISGTASGLTHSVTGQVTVAAQDFTVSLAQSPVQTVYSPGTATFTLSLTSVNNFAGTVYFSGLPSNWITYINNNPQSPAQIPDATLAAGGTASVSFGISFPSGLSSGQMGFSIYAGSGSINHAANVWISVSSGAASTLSISSSHSGSFTVGQPASYTISVSDQNGITPTTSGTVTTVTENLPAGLTLSGNMSGTGWSCSGATCTTSNQLSANSSYPAINVPVNVGLNAPSQVYNQATVTGTIGGNVQTASAIDPTTIVGSSTPPDFTLTASQNPQTVAPGGTATYSISVNPLGSFGNSAVSLSMGAIAGGTASVTPSAQSGSPATLTLTASPGASLGTIPVLVTGISGATTHYTVANLKVAPPAPAAIVTPPPGQFIPGGATTFTWNSGNGASQFALTVGSTKGAADLYSGSTGSSQSASMTLPSTIGQTVYATLSSTTSTGVALTPQTYAYTISTQGISSGLQLVSGPVANVSANGGEAAYTYTFSGGDARALTECAPTVEVVTIRLIQQTATTATLGFTAIPGLPVQSFDFSCQCPGSGPGQTNDAPVIFGVSPSSIQPDTSASIQIAGVNFGEPALGATDTVEFCPLSSTGGVLSGCVSYDVTPASDTLIVVDASLQATAYGYGVTVISDENDEESNQASLGVSTSAPIVYDTPPQITSVSPADIPALSGQAVTIIGTNLGSAGSLSICQGPGNCLPWQLAGNWGNTEVSVVVDASSATPGTSYTVTMSTTVDSLGSPFASAPGSPPDSTSGNLDVDGVAYAISGQVTGASAAGVTIYLSGSEAQTTVTDNDGDYTFVVPAGSYTVAPAPSVVYTYVPAYAYFPSLTASQVANFLSVPIAMKLTLVGPNPTVISTDGLYSENTTVQVTAARADNGAAVSGFGGTVNIAEDGTSIYSQNGGTLPLSVTLNNGSFIFTAKSLASPAVQGGNQNGTPAGAAPAPAQIKTINYPVYQGDLAIPQWIVPSPALDPKATGSVYAWVQKRVLDIFAQHTSSSDPVNTVLAAISTYTAADLPNGAAGEVPSLLHAAQSAVTLNPYYTYMRLDSPTAAICGTPAPTNSFTNTLVHEARHTYQGALSAMPNNDQDNDFLVNNVPSALAPTTTLLDTTVVRAVCNESANLTQQLGYQGPTIPDTYGSPNFAGYALEMDAFQFATSQVPQAQPPALTVSSTHAGNFTQGQFNASYTITVSNAPGAGYTTGPINAYEALPSGLDMISMSGLGWTCGGNGGTECTRSDLLGGGASFPPITVLVNVTPNATSPQLNSVGVYGGGSATSSATDSTIVITQ